MTRAPSLAARAALAVGLMVGFYVLAIALIGGLSYIPYAEWVYLHRVDARIAIMCIGAAFAILVGIVPRIDRFDPPGVDAKVHIRSVAGAVGIRTNDASQGRVNSV